MCTQLGSCHGVIINMSPLVIPYFLIVGLFRWCSVWVSCGGLLQRGIFYTCTVFYGSAFSPSSPPSRVWPSLSGFFLLKFSEFDSVYSTDVSIVSSLSFVSILGASWVSPGWYVSWRYQFHLLWCHRRIRWFPGRRRFVRRHSIDRCVSLIMSWGCRVLVACAFRLSFGRGCPFYLLMVQLCICQGRWYLSLLTLTVLFWLGF